ncbi:MAG: GNAT family N-acetyltransferase [Chloroflexi bacterium]|nr:GNAT family N-acetyltransferase [Chloroflexota bacterium]
MQVTVRHATLDDAPGIARVHVESWQSAYRGIVPDDVLDRLDVANRQSRWERIMESAGPQWALLVAEGADDQIIGFANGGPTHSDLPGYECELYAIYLMDSVQSFGLGRRLTEFFAQAMLDYGFRSMMVWVLADNAQAIGFYEHMGGELIAEGIHTIGGVDLKKVAYGWPDLEKILNRS